jgi:hypothetical protein
MAHAHSMFGTEVYKHTIYAILIAFPLQQWLHESASMLSYTNIVCLFQISQILRHKRSILYLSISESFNIRCSHYLEQSFREILICFLKKLTKV